MLGQVKRFTLHASRFTLILFFLTVLLPTQVAHAYSRIISLKPNITEILFALGVGPQVVGVTTFCDRPEEAKKLPKVADYIRVNLEKALRANPDLIIGSKENSSQKEIYFLMDRGIPVQLFSFATIPETLQSIQEIGKLVGKEEQAERLTSQMERELGSLKKRAKGIPKKKVLFVVGHHPLIVAGGTNFFDEATEYLGAINVAHHSRLKYPTYTTEWVIKAAPEVIVVMIGMESGNKEKARKERLEWWQRFPSIPAVKKHQIFTFDIEKMRAVPSLPSTLVELFAKVQGEEDS